METATKETVKFLLIGEERICQQVAYVMSFDNFEIKSFDLLTEENILSLTDVNIYVCDFKRKCRRQVKAVGLKDVKYLEDICREIDKEYYSDCRRHRKELRLQLKTVSPILKFKMWFYDWLKFIYYKIKGYKTIQAAKNFKYNRIENVKYLRCLRPSKLFLLVIFAPVKENIKCSLLEDNIYIATNGDFDGCCSVGIPFGNLFYDGNLNEIYHSVYARIIKLSSLNRSYCLCNQYGFCPTYIDAKSLPLKPL